MAIVNATQKNAVLIDVANDVATELDSASGKRRGSRRRSWRSWGSVLSRLQWLILP